MLPSQLKYKLILCKSLVLPPLTTEGLVMWLSVAEGGWSLQNRIRTALRSRLTDNLEPSRYVFLEMTSLRKGAKGLDGFNFAQLFDVLHPIASSFK